MPEDMVRQGGWETILCPTCYKQFEAANAEGLRRRRKEDEAALQRWADDGGRNLD